MPRLPRFVSILLAVGLSCQSAKSPTPSDSDTAEPTFSLAGEPYEGEALVFPPPSTRRERRSLPRGLADAAPEEGTSVQWPEVDSGGHFEFAGKSLRIELNRRLAEPTEGESLLTITPPVQGKARKSSPWTITFTAEEPFDPEQTYEVTLGALKDDSGKAVSPWKATFRADPQVVLAGKVISYLPEEGKPRVVAIRPYGGSKVGQHPEVEILFDQKVDTGTGKELVGLLASDGTTALPARIRHPRSNRFDGVEIDRRHVVVVEPAEQLTAGDTFIVTARDHGQTDEDAERLSMTIAEPLRFDEVDCGYRTSCSWKDDTLQLEGHNFALTFNNPIVDRKRVQAALSVRPAVRNLSVWVDTWSGEGKISISGAFEPSKEYRVHLGRIKDVYGSPLLRPVDFVVQTRPLPASVSIATGVQFLDAAHSRAFEVVTRNVEEATLRAWEVEPTQANWREAERLVSSRELPDGKPDAEFSIDPQEQRDQDVTTKVDLLSHLQSGKTYVVSAKHDGVAFDAPEPDYPSWSWAGRPPVALVTVNDDRALAVHTRTLPDATLIHVARLTGGEPLSGALIRLDGVPAGIVTDDQGFATIAMQRSAIQSKLLQVEHGGAQASLPLWTHTVDDRDLTPELSSGATASSSPLRAMMISDRGIYRPGATLHFKGIVRMPDGDELAPVAFAPVRIRVIDPNGKDVHEAMGMTDDMGGFASSWSADASAEIGRYRAIIEPLLEGGELASTTVQIAEFESPRFKVDVEATKSDERRMKATVQGRYLFGAAMEGANASWSLRRSPDAIPHGSLSASGLRFRPRDADETPWVRTGEGQLDEAGTLVLQQDLEVDPALGPQRFTLEAEVTDQSHRAIASRGSVTMHPFERYAGVALGKRWPDVGKPLALQLGVIDTEGKTVTGARMTAVLEHLSWKRTRRPGPGGSVRTQWHQVRKEVGRCQATSASSPVGCDLVPKRSGTYEVSVEVDGHRGGQARLWAWGERGSYPEPTPGRRVEVVADQGSYAAGQTAKLVVQNPFPNATAIFTVESSGLHERSTRKVEAGALTFEVPIEAEYAPHVHATVTLLPIGASGEDVADWKFGAVRLPVDLDDARLQVSVQSDENHYEPGQRATITVDVAHGSKPVANADIALAVVDEGVLRLTNFHAADPVKTLRPGIALSYAVADTRRSLAEMFERSHVAGDGGGAGAASVVSTRRNFVRTALWKPSLRTGPDGKATVSLDLPDNLTEFRMMAVVLDADGRGAAHESSFEVRKPLMGIPVVPRFAVVGDRFEAAVMVHSGQETPTQATVVLDGQSKTVDLAPLGRARVAFELEPAKVQNRSLVFSIRDGDGVERDRVEARLPVQAPGVDERPRLSGSFTRVQEVLIEVPEDVWADLEADDVVSVTVGPQMWPELGTRLEFLVDYPHGCVEQTTSSTLPLLAARDILPRLGFFRYSREEIDERAAAGLQRLASMKTSSGGLAYWPGGWEPNAYGTAYAMRAVALAHKQGIAPPPGLLEGMRDYLVGKLNESYGQGGDTAEIKASIALALAEADALPESSADMLMDTGEAQGVFGLANLALALSTLPDRGDQVEKLLDRIEASFDEHGRLTSAEPNGHYWYYGSSTRTKAQALLALTRLRPQSKIAPMLVSDLVAQTDGYTTQSTAFGLLALREQVMAQDDIEASLRVALDGVTLQPVPELSKLMGDGAGRYDIALAELAGKRRLLRLESSADVAVSYTIDAKWRRPFDDAGTLVATSEDRGPEVYRVYTDAKGASIEPDSIEPGQTVRVSVLSRLPVDRVERDRLGYLAVTDRIPAGFEPIQPDLWTVARPPELTDAHPFHDHLRWGSAEASHVELRDDRVLMYFDRVWGEYAAGTYLMRATTPGRFVAPPAMAELMYEPDSSGYSQHQSFTVVEAP